MNFYKRGDAAKGEDIKAAFEKLNTHSISGYDFSRGDVLFFSFTGKEGVKYMMSTNIDSWLADMITTHPDYKELELPVEPKFKVGDWIVKKGGNTFYGGNYVEQITLIEVDEKGKYIWLPSKVWVDEDCIRLWTIEDAKDGDVLVTDNGWTCIFKAFDGCVFSSYCFMDSQKWFCEVGSEAHTLDSRINGNIHPATKEQRELLFKKMKEAGYQWDVDKKELRKIQLHYDISNFHAGMPVLVRDENDGQWNYTGYSYYDSSRAYKFMTSACQSFVQCIPFNEDTKHLLGTADPCGEEYINW